MMQKEPGIIIGPITRLLGWVFDRVFCVIYNVVQSNALGISIMVITVLVRLLILPLSLQQVKSSIKMQELQPQIKKLREKYLNGGQSNPEIQKKFNFEVQKLYNQNGVNPAGGCILAFIQLPIFMALNQLLANSYRYIGVIGNAYKVLAEKIMSIPGYVSLIRPLAEPKVPSSMQIDLRLLADMQKVINKFTFNDWDVFLSKLDLVTKGQIKGLLIKKESLENFLGIDLIEPCGIKWPGVIIPVLVILVTFLSSYLMTKMTEPKQDDEVSGAQQKIFLLIMPLLMGFLTLNLSSGVGVYWITSSVIQALQQFCVNNFYRKSKGGV